MQSVSMSKACFLKRMFMTCQRCWHRSSTCLFCLKPECIYLVNTISLHAIFGLFSRTTSGNNNPYSPCFIGMNAIWVTGVAFRFKDSCPFSMNSSQSWIQASRGTSRSWWPGRGAGTRLWWRAACCMCGGVTWWATPNIFPCSHSATNTTALANVAWKVSIRKSYCDEKRNSIKFCNSV